jgi:hypothetical protein
MSRTPLNETEVDALLHRDLRPPQPPAGWRERVLAATLYAEPLRDAQARQRALELSRLRGEQVIAQQRNALRRRVLQQALIGAAALAVLPTMVDRLSPVFGAYPNVGLDGLSLAIASVALCCGLVAGFPRQMRLLIGL